MTKELEELKKELSKAGSENDVLSALDGFSRELTDEEVILVFGGNAGMETGTETGGSDEGSTTYETASGVVFTVPDWCPGQINASCIGRCAGAELKPAYLSYQDYICIVNDSCCRIYGSAAE